MSSNKMVSSGDILTSVFDSLVPEGNDRIKAGGAYRRVYSENNTNAQTDPQGKNQAVRSDYGRHIGQPSDEPGNE